MYLSQENLQQIESYLKLKAWKDSDFVLIGHNELLDDATVAVVNGGNNRAILFSEFKQAATEGIIDNIPIATATTKGFISPEDKTKLDNLQLEHAANDSDFGSIKTGYTPLNSTHFPVKVDDDGNAYVHIPSADSHTLGLMMPGDGLEFAEDHINMTIATDEGVGGVKVGYTPAAGSNTYAVELDSNGNAFVTVPNSATVPTATASQKGIVYRIDNPDLVHSDELGNYGVPNYNLFINKLNEKANAATSLTVNNNAGNYVFNSIGNKYPLKIQNIIADEGQSFDTISPIIMLRSVKAGSEGSLYMVQATPNNAGVMTANGYSHLQALHIVSLTQEQYDAIKYPQDTRNVNITYNIIGGSTIRTITYDSTAKKWSDD